MRQLEKVSRELLAGLARRAALLPGAERLAFIDIDSMQRRVYGHKKQGAAFGHAKISGKTVLVRGLNALAATEAQQPSWSSQMARGYLMAAHASSPIAGAAGDEASALVPGQRLRARVPRFPT